jgi:hypothetical protein
MKRVLLSGLLCLPVVAAEDYDFFEKRVRPVLVKRCYACHSVGSQPMQGGLSVDTKEGLLRGGKSGVPAIVPGDANSLLLRAVQGRAADLKMPPGKRIPDEEVKALVEWVKNGARDPRTGPAPALPAVAAYDWDKEGEHWAFRPVRDSKPAPVADREWNGNDIDRFVKSELDEKRLRPQPRATKQALIRRVTYDLTGLPPTSAEVKAFLDDPSANAFEKVVDRLLASSQYGEHWGRHWLDLVRYADTAGRSYELPEVAALNGDGSPDFQFLEQGPRVGLSRIGFVFGAHQYLRSAPDLGAR